MSGARLLLNTRGTFVKDPEYTLFSSDSAPREEYIAGTFEIPFDSVTTFGGKASVLIPQKGDVVRRVSIRSKLPVLYSPLGPGYVYPLYTDQVDGSIYVLTNTLAIQPGDFVGYFNTQFLNAWATNFVGTGNISVAYDATQNKFVFTSPTYAYIFFQNESSASFWGFDIRTPDLTVNGYPAFRFTSGTLTAPLTLVQAGWIRGFTPPPPTGFSYVDSVACRLIKEATLTIGGQTIDRLTSERLIIEDDLGMPYENQAGLTILEGKNDSSAITIQREYYTRLTFNTDTISMNALEKQDVRVNVEFEKFENLPSSYISSNGFLDGASYITSNLQAITGDAGENFDPVWFVGWKNYVIIGPLLNNSFRFYNEDTGTWYKWTPGSGSDAFITTNGGTVYGSGGGTLRKADIATILASSTTPWTSGYNPFSSFPSNPWGDGNNTIGAILTDARYVYLFYKVNYFIIGSTYTSIVSGLLDGTSTIWTITYRFYNKSGSLSASDQTALSTFWTSYCGAFTSAVITGYANSGSDLLVTADLTYATPQPSGNEYIPGVNVHNNLIWVRYDSTASFTSASSYTWTLTSGGLPASVKDVLPGYDTLQLPNTSYYFKSTFDGRYIYFPTSPDFIAKLDTQNFLSTSAYTQVSGALLSPNPVFNTDGPFISDGQYLYPSSSSVRGSNGTFSRYDSTTAIDQQSSWEYYTGDTLIRTNDFEFSIPAGFDGKYVYFYTQSQIQKTTFPETDFSRVTTWHKYDTTKPFNSISSWEWIDFRPGNIVTASDGSSPQITLNAHRTDMPEYYTGKVVAYSNVSGTSSDSINRMISDVNGNIYAVGNYQSTGAVTLRNIDTTASASGYTLPSSGGGSDGFVMKYDSNGSVIGYSYIVGNGADLIRFVTSDLGGNVYVMGSYTSTGTVTIRNIDTTASVSAYSLPITAGGSDGFVIKYNSNGTVLGYTYINGTITDITWSAAVDSNGNLYITGQYQSSGTVTLRNIDTTASASAYNLPISSGNSDGFVIKYDSNGNVTGYSYIVGSASDIMRSVNIDSNGNLYITGQYQSTGAVTLRNIDTTASASGYTLPSSGGSNTDGFVIKYDSNGSVIGYSYIAGTSTDIVYSVSFDLGGNVYVMGSYTSTGTVTIRNIDTTATDSGYTFPISSGSTDGFIIKYDANGNVLGYSYITGTGADIIYSATSDSNGNLFIAGQYNSTGTVTILNINTSASASAYSLPISTGIDGFIISYDPNGNCIGYSNISGTSSDTIFSIMTDSSDNVYIAGSYQSTTDVTLKNIDFTASASPYSLRASSGGTDGFIVKYGARSVINIFYSTIIPKIRFIIGSRYIYITEGDGRGYNVTLQDFVQYNPITMPWSGTNFPSSTLVKYENHNTPPATNQVGLYGQTDLNEFTIRQGRTTESFELRFLNPVREIWVVVDSPGVISRFVLRLNNEILVDDDQITTRYQRTFETHTTMPTSSNVNVYSFSFDPEKLSPSGTLNMSRIAYPTIEVTLASAAPTDLELRVYSKSFNVLGYQGGLGGLLFNSAL